jgi:hypothetical protein
VSTARRASDGHRASEEEDTRDEHERCAAGGSGRRRFARLCVGLLLGQALAKLSVFSAQRVEVSQRRFVLVSVRVAHGPYEIER